MTEDDRVVDLPDAGVPADQGLSSLGLIMQLAGNIFAAIATMAAIDILILAGSTRGGSSEMVWVFLIVGVSVARSMFQRAAGSQLLYGNPHDIAGGRLAGIRRYITFALIHTAIVFLMMVAKWDAPAKIAFGVAAGLAAWPVALAIILSRPRFQKFRDDLPMTEDKGFEGASILMTVLGLCGLIGGGAALLMMLQLPAEVLKHGMTIIVVLATGMLVARSAIHVQAGLSGLRETSVDRSVELANRYANFGIISSFCAAGALLMFFMQGRIELSVFVVIVVVAWVLMAWPLVIRRFFGDRQFADLLAGDNAPTHRRAPDAGITSLGWLLLGYAAYEATLLIPVLIAGSFNSEDTMMLLGAGATRSIWWSVAKVTLQAWAGYELVRMSPQSKLIGTIYGVAGAGVVLYLAWPIIKIVKLGGGHFIGMNGIAMQVMIASTAIALVLPIATVLLVNRKIAPTARARFRAKPPETPAPQ